MTARILFKKKIDHKPRNYSFPLRLLHRLIIFFPHLFSKVLVLCSSPDKQAKHMATWHGAATPLKYNVKHLSHCLATETVKCVNTESKNRAQLISAISLIALWAQLLSSNVNQKHRKRKRGAEREGCYSDLNWKCSQGQRAMIRPFFYSQTSPLVPSSQYTHIPLHSLSVTPQWLSLKGLVLCMLIDFWPRCLWNQLYLSPFCSPLF